MRVLESERVLVRPANLYSVVPSRVLADEDLCGCVLRFLPAEDLLRCAQTCHAWSVAALDDELWIVHRREQRDANVPWSPLTSELEAATAAQANFRSWVSEYAAAVAHGECERLQGMPVWSRGADGEADWPGVVCNEQLGRDEDVCVMLPAASSDPL